MSGAALMRSVFKGRWLPAIRKWIPAFVILIGILFILRGMGLGIPYISPPAPKDQVTTSMECQP
jgi:hypothetical protein